MVHIFKYREMIDAFGFKIMVSSPYHEKHFCTQSFSMTYFHHLGTSLFLTKKGPHLIHFIFRNFGALYFHFSWIIWGHVPFLHPKIIGKGETGVLWYEHQNSERREGGCDERDVGMKESSEGNVNPLPLYEFVPISFWRWQYHVRS